MLSASYVRGKSNPDCLSAGQDEPKEGDRAGEPQRLLQTEQDTSQNHWYCPGWKSRKIVLGDFLRGLDFDARFRGDAVLLGGLHDKGETDEEADRSDQL